MTSDTWVMVDCNTTTRENHPQTVPMCFPPIDILPAQIRFDDRSTLRVLFDKPLTRRCVDKKGIIKPRCDATVRPYTRTIGEHDTIAPDLFEKSDDVWWLECPALLAEMRTRKRISC